MKLVLRLHKLYQNYLVIVICLISTTFTGSSSKTKQKKSCSPHLSCRDQYSLPVMQKSGKLAFYHCRLKAVRITTPAAVKSQNAVLSAI